MFWILQIKRSSTVVPPFAQQAVMMTIVAIVAVHTMEVTMVENHKIRRKG